MKKVEKGVRMVGSQSPQENNSRSCGTSLRDTRARQQPGPPERLPGLYKKSIRALSFLLLPAHKQGGSMRAGTRDFPLSCLAHTGFPVLILALFYLTGALSVAADIPVPAEMPSEPNR